MSAAVCRPRPPWRWTLLYQPKKSWQWALPLRVTSPASPTTGGFGVSRLERSNITSPTARHPHLPRWGRSRRERRPEPVVLHAGHRCRRSDRLSAESAGSLSIEYGNLLWLTRMWTAERRPPKCAVRYEMGRTALLWRRSADRDPAMAAMRRSPNGPAAERGSRKCNGVSETPGQGH